MPNSDVTLPRWPGPHELSQALCESDAPEWGEEDCTMKKRRHTPERLIRKLAEGEKLLAQGQTLGQVCRHLEITESTWHRWCNQYGGIKADAAKPLKELEKENSRLKKLLAEAELDKSMLKELAEGNF